MSAAREVPSGRRHGSAASLAARAVNVVLGERTVLAGVELDLPAGEVTLLAGRNGAGKSTLLAVLAGIRRPQRGAVTLGGTDVRQLPHRARARAITLIPQQQDSPFEFTGRELVTMGRHPHVPRLRGPGPADRDAVERALQVADAQAFADRSVRTLSGGEMQRIAIARALATDAAILLADEPTANLDLEHALSILDLLRGLADAGRTVLIASHDLNLAAPRAHRVALLHEGRIACLGVPEAVLSVDNVQRVFGVASGPAHGFFPRAFESR